MLFDLVCDDGNRENGDSCSSSCTVEAGFRCANGSSVSPSNCFYQDQLALSLVLNHTNKLELELRYGGIFVFKLLPYSAMLKKTLISELKFENAAIETLSWTYSNDSL